MRAPDMTSSLRRERPIVPVMAGAKFHATQPMKNGIPAKKHIVQVLGQIRRTCEPQPESEEGRGTVTRRSL